MSERRPPRDLETLVSRYIRLKMSGGEDEEEVLGRLDLCMEARPARSKRKRDSDSDDKGTENLNNIRLTGAIAQYLLSRVPLPTSRTDLQKRFIKSEGSKKVNLDSILNQINETFKTCMGLGIFGLDKSATSQSSSNPKYYVVQLNRSKVHLDLVYQFGSINIKSIGELAIDQDQDESQLVSYRLCNSFLTFLSFLFGFFEVTLSDENIVQDEQNPFKVLQNCQEIEIPIGKSIPPLPIHPNTPHSRLPLRTRP
ncbi:hypothetical protein OJ253_2275 [Cryptosporidium canis]|uniref:Uncharacterized protein n=1 Tax=Cryptosporidium canis TaxID=195482 RepID=A0A9D5HWX7_9CRYT|nr:hypothetical protein OJ253_2275 [Cryptosporidium canis]